MDWVWVALAVFAAGVAVESLFRRVRRWNAADDAEKAMASPYTKDGPRQLRALLAVRGHLLTREQRGECVSWLAEREPPNAAG